jgi:hypothetical protein
MVLRIPIVVVPTVTKLAPDRSGPVLVGGSHAAVYPVFLAAQSGARAAVLHDGGIGKDDAGVAGLAWADSIGMAVAAVAARSARIGDGEHVMAAGVISRANEAASALGVVPGMRASEAAERLCAAHLPSHRPRHIEETRVLYALPATRQAVVCLDSISLAHSYDSRYIMACGSHGGVPSANYAMEIRPSLVIFNDAAPAAEHSGIAALALLGEEGIAAAAVASSSARIGDGRSTLVDGVISALNEAAAAFGGKVGMAARELAQLVAGATDGISQSAAAPADETGALLPHP